MAFTWRSFEWRCSDDDNIYAVDDDELQNNEKTLNEGESISQARPGQTIIRPRRSRPITSIARYASELLEINFRKINSVYGGIENREERNPLK